MNRLKVMCCIYIALVIQAISVFGDTHVASSASYADVAAAVSAASAGDTVQVPAGSSTWSSQLVITKGIILQGQGESTVITGNVGGSTYLVRYAPATPANNEAFRMTAITFDLNNDSLALWLSNSSSTYAQTSIRIDNCTFNNCIRTTVLIDGPMWGVIDNNIFEGEVHLDNYAQNSCSDWSEQTFSLGSADNLYWEDNTITTDYTIVTGGHGGRYVYRHNTISYTHATQGAYPLFDMHGNQPGDIVSPRGGEIYGNTITYTGGGGVNGRLVDHRGGQMVVYNNTVSGFGSIDFQIREEYCDSITCSGTYEMHVKDSYYWSNTNNSSYLSSYPVVNSCGEYSIAANQDFWVHDEAFDGSSGVGVGTLGERPSSGLTAGVGYWATDESTLYRATGAASWEVYYTPYTYPHPLRGEGGGGSNLIALFLVSMVGRVACISMLMLMLSGVARILYVSRKRLRKAM